eukprot:TRINITY_DN67602_c7_g1_i1.p2 TRINITY_DN67602_c7_g1~~TRINITY_DN67602_c7_g1_i1.p2  ORF type:complete len:137 (+),score=4.67 TRINITY_DN67602_c7_g1_i1:430-840(+)
MWKKFRCGRLNGFALQVLHNSQCHRQQCFARHCNKCGFVVFPELPLRCWKVVQVGEVKVSTERKLDNCLVFVSACKVHQCPSQYCHVPTLHQRNKGKFLLFGWQPGWHRTAMSAKLAQRSSMQKEALGLFNGNARF